MNSRLELECSPKPQNVRAQINWLGPNGNVVSDSSNIVFDKFQQQHEGRYTCQILLPNQVILRQVCNKYSLKCLIFVIKLINFINIQIGIN